MNEEGPGPLSGIRVIELCTGISGPFAAKWWVDAGADVIKVEPPGGDPMRRHTTSGEPPPEGPDGALFQYLNAGKRSFVVDLDRDPSKVAALVRGAAILFEDLGPGGLESHGLDPERWIADNPGLSIVRLSDWGQTGPWATRPATEFTQQAQTGAICFRGLRDREPVAAGGRLGEWIAGQFAAVGALAAWLGSEAGGAGQIVDCSTFESLILTLNVYHDLNGQFFEGPLPRAVEIPSIERAQDGWVGFCTVTGQQWVDFCSMIGRQDIGEDHRFLEIRARMDHIDFIKQAIEEFTTEKTVDELIELASLLRIPVAPVGNGATLPKLDHVVARGIFQRTAGGFLQPRRPYLLEKTSFPALRPPPRLDADRAAVEGLIDEAKGPAPSPGATGAKPRLPLEGLRVLDLTAFWAGPFATSVLADLGADVLKVESIQRPDGMRFAGAVRNARLWEWSPVFHGANPGKRAITLRMDDEEGLALVKRLVAESDLVIENYSARVFENFGLGWEDVRQLNPDIIMVRMPAFGLDGPWRDRAGFAMTVEQVSGLAAVTGYPDMPLVVRGACDPLGGLTALFAMLLALKERERTGQGQLVEIPLLETALNVAAEQVIEHSAYGVLLGSEGNRSRVAAPQGVYRAADDPGAAPIDPVEGEWRSYVALSIRNEAQWQALCGLLGADDWASDPALSSMLGRRAAHDRIDERLSAFFAEKPMTAAAEQLVAAGIPAAPTVNAHFQMPNPQLEHRGFFQILEHPETGPTRYPGLPFAFSAWPRALHRMPPPTLGQDNRSVLAERLGLGDAEIDALEEKQVIGTRPSFM